MTGSDIGPITLNLYFAYYLLHQKVIDDTSWNLSSFQAIFEKKTTKVPSRNLQIWYTVNYNTIINAMEKSKQGNIFPGWEDNSRFGGSLDLKLWNGLSELKKCERNGERDIKTNIFVIEK